MDIGRRSDDPASPSPDLTSYLYIVMTLMYIVFLYQNILSVCLSVTQCVAALWLLYLLCIYLVFNLNQRALVHFSLLLESPINSTFANQIALSIHSLLQCLLIDTALA